MMIGDRVRFLDNPFNEPLPDGVIIDVLELYPSNAPFSYSVLWDDGERGEMVPEQIELVTP